jgi:hypothetical protein
MFLRFSFLPVITIGMHFDYTIEMKLLFYPPILISKNMEAKGSTTSRAPSIQAQGLCLTK